MTKIVALLSGGLDSTVLTVRLVRAGYEVLPITVLYGQRHVREVEAARKVAATYQLRHQVVDLEALRAVMGGSSQTDAAVAVPHGHYAEASMRVTVVPNRNMVLLAVATAYAISEHASHVAYAAHAGDYTIYPDCRPEFVAAMQEAMRRCDYLPITLDAPFAFVSKAGIVAEGALLEVPFGLTYSCYEGDVVHCGRCGTCMERREAFALAHVVDPTVYRG